MEKAEYWCIYFPSDNTVSVISKTNCTLRDAFTEQTFLLFASVHEQQLQPVANPGVKYPSE